MTKYYFIHKFYPHNQIIIEAETEEKAKAVFIDIFGSLKDYKFETDDK